MKAQNTEKKCLSLFCFVRDHKERSGMCALFTAFDKVLFAVKQKGKEADADSTAFYPVD